MFSTSSPTTPRFAKHSVDQFHSPNPATDGVLNNSPCKAQLFAKYVF